MTIGILYQDGLKEYDFGPGHPFRGDRYQLFLRLLKEKLPEDDNYRILRADPATDDDLRLICTQEYIDFTREFYRAAQLGESHTAEKFFSYHSMDNMPIDNPGRVEEAARLVVGQAKQSCRLVQGGEFQKVVSIGGGLHHAKPSYGEGFCLYNDVAFCGIYLMKEFGLERILILDTDAHAGNGTAEYFYEEPRVLFIDLHQDPRTLYPGTGFAHEIGAGAGKGFTVNVPLPPGASQESYELVFQSLVEPLVQEFQPQIIIRNGGSDPHFNDELTGLGLPMSGFKMIGDKIRQIAGVCGGREIDLIASGYNREVLPRAWLALICGLVGIELEIEELTSQPMMADRSYAATQRVIAELRNNLKEYWKCLR
ncbi:MAG: hypothetical protein PHR43_02425 [Dehalococcoidales bacterium]|nr:hypothetical protein [Dehalococcoidales bacterium]